MKSLVLVTLIFSGCVIKDVKPWQKASLAKESFNQGACSKEFSKFQNHIYFSKEASNGGRGIEGGGCGCN